MKVFTVSLHFGGGVIAVTSSLKYAIERGDAYMHECGYSSREYFIEKWEVDGKETIIEVPSDLPPLNP